MSRLWSRWRRWGLASGIGPASGSIVLLLAAGADPLRAAEPESIGVGPVPSLSLALELTPAPAESSTAPPVPGFGLRSVDISYRLWADGPGPTGFGLGVDSRGDWQALPDAPSVLRLQRSTLVLAMRYQLSNASSLVLDVQPSDAHGLWRPFDELRPRLGFEFRSSSAGAQMLRQRMLRMQLGSDAYLGLRATRNGASLVYRGTF